MYWFKKFSQIIFFVGLCNLSKRITCKVTKHTELSPNFGKHSDYTGVISDISINHALTHQTVTRVDLEPTVPIMEAKVGDKYNVSSLLTSHVLALQDFTISYTIQLYQ